MNSVQTSIIVKASEWCLSWYSGWIAWYNDACFFMGLMGFLSCSLWLQWRYINKTVGPGYGNVSLSLKLKLINKLCWVAFGLSQWWQLGVDKDGEEGTGASVEKHSCLVYVHWIRVSGGRYWSNQEEGKHEGRLGKQELKEGTQEGWDTVCD
jgi:hypothetical protein